MPALASLGLLMLAATADLVATTAAALLLVAGAPESRATTMTVNGSASSLGVACGGAVGGLVLAVADYWALGAAGMMCLLTAATLLWCSRPRAERGVTVSGAS